MWMWSTGINRNIVECKACCWKNHWKRDTSINRNIVECKGLRNCQNEHWNLVLIETLWNVKHYVKNVFGQDEKVLIETLWNVKTYRSMRYHKALQVLIETLWNVKYQYSSYLYGLHWY